MPKSNPTFTGNMQKTHGGTRTKEKPDKSPNRAPSPGPEEKTWNLVLSKIPTKKMKTQKKPKTAQHVPDKKCRVIRRSSDVKRAGKDWRTNKTLTITRNHAHENP